MQVSVCCICKNEANRLRQWFESIKEADHIVVIDTGSTDESLQILDELSELHPSFGVGIFAGTFRFDKARQASFDLAPNDSIKMWIDIDEVFTKGWSDELRALKAIPAKIQTTMNYGSLRYTQTKGGNSESVWRYRVHEVLDTGLGSVYKTQFETTHDQEAGKEYRSNYLDLLKADFDEYQDARTCFYLLREYCYSEDIVNLTNVLTLLAFIETLEGWDQYLLFSRFHAAKFLSKLGGDWETVVYKFADHPSTEAMYEASNAAANAGSHFMALHFAFKALSTTTETNLMFGYPEQAKQGSKQIIYDSLLALNLYDKALFYGSSFHLDISAVVGQIKSTQAT
jgi:glycosyltransferase involved in cell wall biosynthesis